MEEEIFLNKVFQYNNGIFLSVFESDDGWDYALYSSDYHELDTGMYDDPNIDFDSVLDILESENNLNGDSKIEINYDEFNKNIYLNMDEEKW